MLSLSYSLLLGIQIYNILFPTKQDHDPGLRFSFADPGPLIIE